MLGQPVLEQSAFSLHRNQGASHENALSTSEEKRAPSSFHRNQGASHENALSTSDEKERPPASTGIRVQVMKTP